MSADTGEHRQIIAGDMQEVGHALGTLFDMQAFAQFRILGGYPDRTHAGLADTVLLAGHGHHRGGSNRHSVRPHGEGFHKVARYAQPAGDDQIHIALVLAQVLFGAVQRIDGRYGTGILEHFWAGPCGAAPAVDGDKSAPE